MRTCTVVVMLAGCRIHFDPVPLGDDAGDTSLLDMSLDGPCPAGYQELGASCYRVVSGQMPAPIWIEAELACEADGVGAHLVVVNDAAEAVLVRDLVTTAVADFYIGGSDIVTEGVYLTVTGTPQTYLMWPPSEPDGDAQDCLTGDSSALVQDTACGNANDDYVCEYDGIAADPASYGIGS